MIRFRWAVAIALLAVWSSEASAKNLWEERRRQGPYGVAQPPIAPPQPAAATAPMEDAAAPSDVAVPAEAAIQSALTPLEARYDADSDGYLSDGEGRVYLQERAAILRTEGRVTVHTDLERAYDVDGDGVISGSEADAFFADLEP